MNEPEATFNTNWLGFCYLTIPDGADQGLVNLMRHMFYAGAIHYLGLLLDKDEPDYEDHMVAIDAELRAFVGGDCEDFIRRVSDLAQTTGLRVQ